MRLLDAALRRHITDGALEVVYANGKRSRMGEAEKDPIIIRFADSRAPWRILLDPRLGAGETYMNGRLTVDPPHDILDLVLLFGGNGPWEVPGHRRQMMRRRGGAIMGRIGRLNARRAAKRNVAHHYDLDDRLYDLFLDADRQYSCAYFTHPEEGLGEAQHAKLAHIAAKLALKPGQRVLDIGCGWGGMALFLNRVADVDVLGITLSEEQLKVARRRAEQAGVADRVRFELIDYRDVTGTFDRIVSVGMFEHVGPLNYRTYFSHCRNLLTPDGVMLLHTIGRMGGPSVTDAWTRKYIFPGGYIPALSEIMRAMEGLKVMVSDVEILRLHYFYTLLHWYRRTMAKRAEIEAIYDARFFRMWQFYLAGAAGAFRYGGLVNYQIQLIKKRDALPITRDYMNEAEWDLREEALPTAIRA